jgi:hypothetical protein
MSYRALPSRLSRQASPAAPRTSAKVLSFPRRNVTSVAIDFGPFSQPVRREGDLLRAMGIGFALEGVAAACFYVVLHHLHLMR